MAVATGFLFFSSHIVDNQPAPVAAVSQHYANAVFARMVLANSRLDLITSQSSVTKLR